MTLNAVMPNITSQPGPGVSASSGRDVLVGFDVLDSISNGPSWGMKQWEQTIVTVDRIEIREFPRIE